MGIFGLLFLIHWFCFILWQNSFNTKFLILATLKYTILFMQTLIIVCNDHYLIPELSITPKGKLIFLRIIFLYGFVQRRQWHPTPVLLPGKSHGQRSLVGCSPWGRKESDTTERLHFHFSLSCIGEGNGNPLQCSCLENPRDGEPGRLPSMGLHRVGHD